jgi:hypothetical protein
MIGLDLVRPLEADWRATLDEIARLRHWPTSREPGALADRVKALSDAYNDPRLARASTGPDNAARLGFFFPRDVPKTAGAVRELLTLGLLDRGGALRLLDLGAGLGASTWGIVRALEASGAHGKVDATWVDSDRQSLEVGTAIARGRQGMSSVALNVQTVVGALSDRSRLGSFDVIVASGLLSELDVGADVRDRVERHAALLSNAIEHHLAPNGSLVVVEPALRDRTRHLHRVRDALVSRGWSNFAPCLHASPCPALERETDWCHEDLPVDLPSWLIPVARAAGLRYEGLTYAYIVVRRDRASVADALLGPSRATRVRVVSEPMRSKGKREAYLCGGFPSLVDAPSEMLGKRLRTDRLDRDRTDDNAAWEEIARGDILVIDPPLTATESRIARGTSIRALKSGNRR